MKQKTRTGKKKIFTIVSLLIGIMLLSNLVSAQATNASLNYVWNGTNWIPWLATSDGKPKVDLNLFNVTAGSLIVDTNVLYVNATNDKVGIGTTSPGSKLTVAGGIYINTTSSHLILEDTDEGGSTRLERDGNGFNIENVSNNVNLFRINDNGNVGIGTTSPGTRLDIKASSVDNNLPFRVTDSAVGEFISMHTSTGGSAGGGSIVINEDSQDLDIRIESDTNTNALFFEGSSGNVGIGVTSPTTVLHTDVGAPASADKNLSIFQSESSRRIGLVWDDSLSTLGLATLTAHNLVFHTNGNSNPRMTIDTNGNVGIGETSPVNLLHIQGSGTSGQVTAAMILENSASGTLGLDITGAAGASRARLLYGGSPGTGTNTLTEAITLDLEGANAGNVGIGTTTPAAPLHVKTSAPAIRLGIEVGFFETTAASSVACDTACSNNVTSYGGFNAGSGSCLKAWNDNNAGTLACSDTSAVAKHCLCTGGY